MIEVVWNDHIMGRMRLHEKDEWKKGINRRRMSQEDSWTGWGKRLEFEKEETELFMKMETIQNAAKQSSAYSLGNPGENQSISWRCNFFSRCCLKKCCYRKCYCGNKCATTWKMLSAVPGIQFLFSEVSHQYHCDQRLHHLHQHHFW